MIWPFLAVVFSGWLFVNASYRGPHWQGWLFKPVTLLLLLLLAWQAPELNITGYLIIAGLVATLVADAFQLLRTERLSLVAGALFTSYLLYTINFILQMNFSFFWPAPLILLSIGVLLLLTVWSKLGAIRWIITSYVVMTLVMVWMAVELYFQRNTDLSFSLLTGATLLLVGNIVWLINRYRLSFRAAEAVIAGCCFIGHFLVVRSLYL